MTEPILPRPDEIFEGAFFSTDDGPVWTDLSDYVELQEGIKAGPRRQNVFDDVAPSSLSIILNNSDGTFNGDRVDSPFYGKINLNVPLRWRIRWPNVTDSAPNMLSYEQSITSDVSQFSVDQGGIHIDSDTSAAWIDDTDPTIIFTGTWATYTNAAFYNGSEQSSNTTASSASFEFIGTDITWYGDKASNRGIANVAIDGGTPTAVDCYSATEHQQSALFSAAGLANALHVITITVTGTKNASSSGYYVDVDAFVVSTIATPPSGQTYDLVWNTGVLDQTDAMVLTGAGPSRSPTDMPIYVKPNTQYSARVLAKCDTKGTGIGFHASAVLRWYDMFGNHLSDTSGTSTALTTSYGTLSVTATSPAGAAMVRVGLANKTVVGPVTRAIVYSGGVSQPQNASQGNAVIIPTTANVGDLALVWDRVADSALTVTSPTGWTLENSWADTKSKTFLYSRIITATDPGKRYLWVASAKCKQMLLLACYSGVNQTTPIHRIAETTETVYRASHTTPNVTTTLANCWIHSAVLDTATATSSWSAPGGESVREIAYATGSTAPTGLCSDDNTAHAAGTYGSKIFTANANTRYATMHTLALAPATGTGPGNVTVQIGQWELVQGSLTTWHEGGHWSGLFTGLTDSWIETYHGELTLMEVAATDRQKQLTAINVQSAIYETIRDQNPIAYYKLGEPETGTSSQQEAANAARVSQPTLTQVKFGTGAGAGDDPPIRWGAGIGPGTDGSSAIMLNPASRDNGYALQCALTNPIANGTAITLLVWWNSVSTATSEVVILRLQDGTIGQTPRVSLDLRGLPGNYIRAWGNLHTDSATYSAIASSNTQLFDGATHLLTGTFQLQGGQLVTTLYIDGVVAASATTATAITEFPIIGLLGLGTATNTAALCSGTYSHAAVFDTALDPSTIADIYAAGTTAFAGDTTDERIGRLCDWENQDDLSLDSSETVLDRHMPDEQTLQNAIRQPALSEGGTVYISGLGKIAFISRVTKERMTSPLLTIPADLIDPSTFSKASSDTLLVNSPAVKRLATQVVATMVDQDSVDIHGIHSKDVDTILASDQDAKNYATFLTAFYGKPKSRCEQVRVDALFLQDWDHVRQIDMWKILRITGLPEVEETTTLDLYIEGWEFEHDEDHWWVTFDTSTAIPFAILNDPVRGMCGAGVVGW